jgi:DNA-binding transcriptional MocR family regulator
MIAARSLSWGGNLNEHDIITTTGGINALAFCMMAAGKPGDTIAMESPCYPGTLQLARSLGLNVLELPTHPVTGVEVDALKKVVHKVNLCLLVPNFNTPLGSCMPEENKRAVVAFLQGSRYDNHLRQLRTTLQQNARHYFDAIANWFPPDTRVSQPQGGIALWVEFNKQINTTELFDTAMKHKIAIAPGRMFSLQDQFENCMRLSLGVQFSAQVDQKIKLLGKLLT